MTTPQDPFATPPEGGSTPPPPPSPPSAPPPSGPAWGAPAPGAPAPGGYGGGYGAPAGQPGYGAPGSRPQGTSNGFGVTALVLGLLGLFTSLIVIGGLFGLIAIVFGILALGKVKRGEASSKGMPIAGIVLGAVSILVAGAVIAFSASIFDDVSNLSECITEAEGDPAAEADCEREFEDSLTQ